MVRKNPAMTAKNTENAKKCDKQEKDASKNGKLAKRLPIDLGALKFSCEFG